MATTTAQILNDSGVPGSTGQSALNALNPFASISALRNNALTSVAGTVQVAGTQGGQFYYNASDTASGWTGTATISGTALTIASTTSGAVAIGQFLNSGTGARVTAGSGVSWTLSAAPGNVGSATAMTADNGGTIIVDTIGRRWYRAYSGAWDVTWFGAAGDGIADDSAVIQAVLTGLPSGQSVLFPAGKTFLVSAYLAMTGKSYGSLIMEGVVKPTGTLNNVNSGLFNLSNCTNFSIKPKIVNQTYTSTLNAILLAGCTNIAVLNGTIDVKYNAYDGTAGIQLGANTSGVLISGNYIRTGYGVLGNDVTGVSDISIIDNEFEGQIFYGSTGTGDAIEANFPTYGSSNWVVCQNRFHGYKVNNPGGANAREILMGFANVNGINADNNVVWNSEMESIHFEAGCTNFTARGNQISSGIIGINVNTNNNVNQSNFVISGNQIAMPVQPSYAAYTVDYGAAILVNVNSIGSGFAKDGTITGNTCTGVTGAARGIVVYDLAHFTLANNDVSGFPRAGYDIRKFNGIGAGPSYGSIAGNQCNACGWNYILGGLGGAGPMLYINFDSTNRSAGSLFALNYDSQISTRTGSVIEFNGNDAAGATLSVGDVLCFDEGPGNPSRAVVYTGGAAGTWAAADTVVDFSKNGSGTTAVVNVTFVSYATANIPALVDISATGCAANGANAESLKASYMVTHSTTVAAITQLGTTTVLGAATIGTSMASLTATFTVTFTSGFTNAISAKVTQPNVHNSSVGGIASFS